MARKFFFWVFNKSERKYFAENQIKEANAFAESVANETGKSVGLYDVNGNVSFLRPRPPEPPELPTLTKARGKQTRKVYVAAYNHRFGTEERAIKAIPSTQFQNVLLAEDYRQDAAESARVRVWKHAIASLKA